MEVEQFFLYEHVSSMPTCFIHLNIITEKFELRVVVIKTLAAPCGVYCGHHGSNNNRKTVLTKILLVNSIHVSNNRKYNINSY